MHNPQKTPQEATNGEKGTNTPGNPQTSQGGTQAQPTDVILAHLDAAITLGVKASELGDVWQRLGHPPCNGTGSGWCDCPPDPDGY